MRSSTTSIKAACLGTVMTLAACGGAAEEAVSEEPPLALRWDHVETSDAWEARGFSALETHANALLSTVPEDIDAWCPDYPENSRTERAQFWLGLLSALSRHESTYNPRAVGGDGRWFGLVQISPGTARAYGCDAGSGEALLNGAANVSCALRIWATTVPRDNVVSDGNRGVAADWGPMHSSQARKRDDIRDWVSSQSFCQG